MKVHLNSNSNINLIQAQKTLEQAVKIPQQITKDLLKLQNKMLNANVTAKVQSRKIDTYA